MNHIMALFRWMKNKERQASYSIRSRYIATGAKSCKVYGTFFIIIGKKRHTNNGILLSSKYGTKLTTTCWQSKTHSPDMSQMTNNETNSLSVHLGKISNGMIKSISSSRIHRLLALHGSLHNSMVGLQCVDVILILSKYLLLNSLAETILRNQFDNFCSVFFFGHNPTDLS